MAHAIHNYFDYKAQIADAELRIKLRQGRGSLLIGLTFLAACLSARELIAGLGHRYRLRNRTGGPAHQRLGGDVAPDPDFLYDWWPIRNLRTLYNKLSRIKVDVRPSS